MHQSTKRNNIGPPGRGALNRALTVPWAVCALTEAWSFRLNSWPSALSSGCADKHQRDEEPDNSRWGSSGPSSICAPRCVPRPSRIGLSEVIPTETHNSSIVTSARPELNTAICRRRPSAPSMMRALAFVRGPALRQAIKATIIDAVDITGPYHARNFATDTWLHRPSTLNSRAATPTDAARKGNGLAGCVRDQLPAANPSMPHTASLGRPFGGPLGRVPPRLDPLTGTDNRNRAYRSTTGTIGRSFTAVTNWPAR